MNIKEWVEKLGLTPPKKYTPDEARQYNLEEAERKQNQHIQICKATIEAAKQIEEMTNTQGWKVMEAYLNGLVNEAKEEVLKMKPELSVEECRLAANIVRKIFDRLERFKLEKEEALGVLQQYMVAEKSLEKESEPE